MVKSNVRTAVRRQVNQQFGQHYDKRQQMQVRNYQNKDFVSGQRTSTKIGITRRFINSIKFYWRKFWSPFATSLDLSKDSLFGSKPGRGAGAFWLRQTFHQNLKMRSTRDGRKV